MKHLIQFIFTISISFCLFSQDKICQQTLILSVKDNSSLFNFENKDQDLLYNIQKRIIDKKLYVYFKHSDKAYHYDTEKKLLQYEIQPMTPLLNSKGEDSIVVSKDGKTKEVVYPERTLVYEKTHFENDLFEYRLVKPLLNRKGEDSLVLSKDGKNMDVVYPESIYTIEKVNFRNIETIKIIEKYDDQKAKLIPSQMFFTFDNNVEAEKDFGINIDELFNINEDKKFLWLEILLNKKYVGKVENQIPCKNNK